MPRVEELLKYLHTLAEAPSPTVDKIIFGRGDSEIKKIGTCWISSLSALEKAYKQGANVVVTHEPTFYAHFDLEGGEHEYAYCRAYKGLKKGEAAYLEMIEKKKAWLTEHDIAVIRCHDVMDRVQRFGMAVSLGRALGFDDGDIVGGGEMYKIYRVESDTAYNVTKRIAARLEQFNLPGVQFYGDRDRVVASVGVGTGCYSDPIEFMEYGADYYLTINDVIHTWTQTSYSNDSGLPIGVVDHGVTEEAGMRALCAHLNENYHECVHINGGAEYQYITA